MTPNYLYSLTPIAIEDCAFSEFLDILKQMENNDAYRIHFPELLTVIALNNMSNDVYSIKDRDVMVRHELMDEGEEKYPAMLFTWWFNGSPFMITHSYGRWGDSHDFWVTDESIMRSALNDLIERLQAQNDTSTIQSPVVNPDSEVADIDTVDGYYLMDYYDPNPSLKYAEGDEVYVWNEVNHLSYEKNYAIFRVRIGTISPHTKRSTYWGQKLDQRWKGNVMVYDHDNGSIGANFSDAWVIGKLTDPLPVAATQYLYENVVNKETQSIDKQTYKFGIESVIDWFKANMPE